MTEENAIEQIRAECLARFGAPVCEAVEAGRVRDYLLALDEPGELVAGRPVPPLFLLTLGRTRRPQPSRGSAVNVGNDYDILAPVYVGDNITVARAVQAIEPKEGKAGRMYLTHVKTTYTNGSAVVVGFGHTRIMRWGW
jgi:hypothetical protein